jgi:LPS-assembly lipoprotein
MTTHHYYSSFQPQGTLIKMHSLKTSFLATLLVMLSACGWHLKGQVDLPANLRILNLTFSGIGFDSQKLIKQALLSNAVTISKDAPYELKILKDSATKRTLAVTSNAKASEYELIQTLTFMVLNYQGQEMSETIEVVTYRTLAYDAAAAIGKAQEEKNMRREMRRDNASKLLQRLQKLPLKEPEL